MFGVGMVEVVGPGVENMKKGDIVMPCESHVGMWRNYVVDSAKKFIPFPITGLKYEQLGLFQYFCLAYIMLHDCENLKPGDCVVMNSPESATGQGSVIQLCKLLQLKVITLLDEGPKYDELCDMLTASGCDSCVEECRKHR